MSEKDEKARELVEWHFEVEPDLVEVFRIISDDEANPAEPIKLLEVNEASMPTGEITAFGFGASKDFPFRTIIAEVTPKEFAALKPSGRLPERVAARHRHPVHAAAGCLSVAPSRAAWADAFAEQARLLHLGRARGAPSPSERRG